MASVLWCHNDSIQTLYKVMMMIKLLIKHAPLVGSVRAIDTQYLVRKWQRLPQQTPSRRDYPDLTSIHNACATPLPRLMPQVESLGITHQNQKESEDLHEVNVWCLCSH